MLQHHPEVDVVGLTAEKKRFGLDGFLVVRGLFSADEAALLREVAHRDQTRAVSLLGSDEGHRRVRLSLNHTLADDAYGAVLRSRRVVARMEAFLEGRVEFFHFKVIEKDARRGAAWAWHQDYGYWHTFDGFQYPTLASCAIALDDADRRNGCMQVLAGSHRLGRLDHTTETQLCANPARVEAAKKAHALVFCELRAGDAVFFHCNLLHCSSANESPRPRWALIGCYNAVGNRRLEQATTPRPLRALDDKRVMPAIRKHLRTLGTEP